MIEVDELTLETVKQLFPKVRENAAVTGNIPMIVFECLEPELRRVMKQHDLKAIYRGPRLSNNTVRRARSMTCRCDATSVLLYRK